MPTRRILFLIILISAFTGCENDEPGNNHLELLKVFVGTTELNLEGINSNLPIDQVITLTFSLPLDQTTATNSIRLMHDDQTVNTDINFLYQDKTVVLRPSGTLNSGESYTLDVSNTLQGAKGEEFSGRTIEFSTVPRSLVITSIKTNGQEILSTQPATDVPVNDLRIEISFSAALDPSTIDNAFAIAGFSSVPVTVALSGENKTLALTATQMLSGFRTYQLTITDQVRSANGEPFSGYRKVFYTRADPTPDFPLISDNALLTLVQQQTFKYFWDFAHPESGMARERNTSGNTVTSGGSGFGIMALVVGMERGFITRAEGLARMDKILTFLESADRFHGVWPHWMNGNTGKVIPFSPNDNGGDLVETSFLIQGLLTFRQYMDATVATEKVLIDRINALWHAVEWDWYTRDGQNVLYWHWSPDKQWTMNHPIRGYHEALITYFLAAASPSHSIAPSVYHEGWARNGDIVNNREFYNISLPVGPDYGGPLFFAHYSFLGLDPRGLSDTYANYWTQNVNHALINHAYCVVNPKKFVGYSDENWGLTASDHQGGYAAHSPTNDLGVITPTAALSSFPYTPELSMKALKFFYYTLGDRLWGNYGFFDAFNITAGWTADSYLAIDQGPIIVMIENYRTGLLWDLFMSSPEVRIGMDKLGFTR